MKTCSICNKIYKDDNLNFCLDDGGVLIESKDDAPPTIQMNRVRTTDPNFSDYQPSSLWGSQPLQTHQSNYPNQTGQTNQPFYQMTNAATGQNQVLPTISLVLGLCGLVLWCCYGGFPFGIAALITGYLGYRNAENNPQQYTGRGMAIAGMILGIVGFLGTIMLIILGLAGSIFK